MNATMEDTDSVEAVVGEFDPPCDVTDRFGRPHGVFHECRRPAQWIAIMRCCGRHRLHCDYHLKAIQARVSDTCSLRCLGCDVVHRSNPYKSVAAI